MNNKIKHIYISPNRLCAGGTNGYVPPEALVTPYRTRPVSCANVGLSSIRRYAPGYSPSGGLGFTAVRFEARLSYIVCYGFATQLFFCIQLPSSEFFCYHYCLFVVAIYFIYPICSYLHQPSWNLQPVQAFAYLTAIKQKIGNGYG